MANPISSNAGSGGHRLLYIDDDALALKSLTALLETLGYVVDAVDDASTGLERFIERKQSLVITDMNMPKMNGLRLTKEIKRVSPDTPVIVISGSVQLERTGSEEESRPDCILVKPLRFDEFTGHLDRLLNKTSSGEQQRAVKE